MAVKLDVKKLGLAILFALVLVTIISYFASTFMDIPMIRTGPAFIVLFIAIFITMVFVFAQDGKFDGSDWAVMLLLTIGLVGSAWVLKHFLPEIFSSLPRSTREVFSAFGI